MHERQQSRPPSIKLRISDEHEWYVQGDTIRGDVLVAVLNAGCHVHSLNVKIECTETAEIISSRREEISRYHKITNLLSSDRLITGCHLFTYMINIPKSTGHVSGFPPSFDVGDGGLKYGIRGGITWSLQAELVYAEQQKIEDTSVIRVLPLPSKNDLMLTGARGDVHTYRNKSFEVTVDYPYQLPQSPNICSMDFKIRLGAPTFVHTVEVGLQISVVMWIEAEARSFLACEPLETVQVDAIVDKLELSGASRRWQIQGPLPSEFSTPCMNLCYYLCLRMTFADNSTAAMRWSNVTVAPAALVRATPKSLPASHVDDACAPPAYSET